LSCILLTAFSALTLLFGRHERIWPVNTRCWYVGWWWFD